MATRPQISKKQIEKTADAAAELATSKRVEASLELKTQQRTEDRSFPVVGVGASAGGLEAFTQLVRALPANSGVALVLVQHLDPKHESMLVSILSRDPAARCGGEVRHGGATEPCVYHAARR